MTWYGDNKRHSDVQKKGEDNDTLRTPMAPENLSEEIIGKLKPKSKEFTESFNRMLRGEFVKSIDQDPFQVMGASPGKGWRRIDADILIIHGDVLRSTDGKQLAITEWSEDDAGTLIYNISPEIPDKEIPALLQAHYDYPLAYAPMSKVGDDEEVVKGATITPREMSVVELKENGNIVRKKTGYTYRVTFKHIQVWNIFNTRTEAIANIKDAVPRIIAAANRVKNQEYKDFDTAEEAKEFFKDKKMMDHTPIRVKNPYHPERWMYYEGQYGIFGLNASPTHEHKIPEWAEFWAKTTPYNEQNEIEKCKALGHEITHDLVSKRRGKALSKNI